MSVQVEVVRDFFDAINRNEMQSITRHFDSQIVRIEFEGLPTAGTYRGIAMVQEHVSKGRNTWAEGACEPEAFFEKGNKVVVYLHARVRLRGATEWIDGRFADGFAFQSGKITEYHSFAKREQALRWADIAH
jgi:uncharacterized protein